MWAATSVEKREYPWFIESVQDCWSDLNEMSKAIIHNCGVKPGINHIKKGCCARPARYVDYTDHGRHCDKENPFDLLLSLDVSAIHDWSPLDLNS
jgi:hypothetical protein